MQKNGKLCKNSAIKRENEQTWFLVGLSLICKYYLVMIMCQMSRIT